MKSQTILLVAALLAFVGCAPKTVRGPWETVKYGTPQEVQAVLDKGLAKANDIDDSSSVHMTLLMWAAEYNSNPGVTATILKAGGDVTMRSAESGGYGWTALMWAANANKNPEVITTLVNAGSDIKAVDNNGLTPLMIAAEYNTNAPVVAKVASLASDLEATDNGGFTALMLAASKTHNADVVMVLLKAGADAKAKNTKG